MAWTTEKATWFASRLGCFFAFGLCFMLHPPYIIIIILVFYDRDGLMLKAKRNLYYTKFLEGKIFKVSQYQGLKGRQAGLLILGSIG